MKKDAEAQRTSLAFRAKQDASEIIEKGEKSIEDEARKKLDAVKEAIGKERKAIIEKEQAETEKIKQNALKKMDSAVHYLITQFEVELLK